MTADLTNTKSTTPEAEAPKEEIKISSDLSFTESCKESAREVELPGKFIKAKEEEAAAIEQVVNEVSATQSPDAIKLSDVTIEDLSTKRDALYENISSEIKEQFGIGAVHQEVDAKIKAWNTENINESLELESRARAELEKKEKAQDQEPKSIIDIIIDKILQFLGLEQKQDQKDGKRQGKNDKEKSSAKSKKGKKDSPVVKFLKSVGLLE